MNRWEAGVYVGDPEPEMEGPDPLLERMKKARPVCRKPRGHDARLREAAREVINAAESHRAMNRGADPWYMGAALAALRAALGEPTPANRHGFTCGRCEWGRDRLRTITEYTAHVAATGHIGEEPTP